MNILIDTHVVLWLQTEPERIAVDVLGQIADPDVTVLLSSASLWEIAIKYANGKLPLPERVDEWFPAYLRDQNIDVLPVRAEHALRVATLPMHHRDPFDRMLIAQAQIENLPIVTVDRSFDSYEVEVKRAIR